MTLTIIQEDASITLGGTAYDDSNVLKLRYEGNVTTKLKIDNIMFPLLKYIKQQDKTIKLEE